MLVFCQVAINEVTRRYLVLLPQVVYQFAFVISSRSFLGNFEIENIRASTRDKNNDSVYKQILFECRDIEDSKTVTGERFQFVVQLAPWNHDASVLQWF